MRLDGARVGCWAGQLDAGLGRGGGGVAGRGQRGELCADNKERVA